MGHTYTLKKLQIQDIAMTKTEDPNCDMDNKTFCTDVAGFKWWPPLVCSVDGRPVLSSRSGSASGGIAVRMRKNHALTANSPTKQPTGTRSQTAPASPHPRGTKTPIRQNRCDELISQSPITLRPRVSQNSSTDTTTAKRMSMAHRKDLYRPHNPFLAENKPIKSLISSRSQVGLPPIAEDGGVPGSRGELEEVGYGKLGGAEDSSTGAGGAIYSDRRLEEFLSDERGVWGVGGG
ncbi:hypothetical protein DFH27DRAFT_602275 [Peziza echinospora]|nr:hypothetical protein DFH27DRAFT_602275 [Peziza echinospora]